MFRDSKTLIIAAVLTVFAVLINLQAYLASGWVVGIISLVGTFALAWVIVALTRILLDHRS